VVDDIWAGKIPFDTVRHPELAIVQDIAVQAGQGRIQDRSTETLGVPMRVSRSGAVFSNANYRSSPTAERRRNGNARPTTSFPSSASGETLMAVTDRIAPARKPRSSVDLATTKPGTPGGIFMRQFWHAICRSVDLPKGRARPVRVMNEDYTLYRGESGRAQLVAQRCPHAAR